MTAPQTTKQNRPESGPATLGDVLYSSSPQPGLPESEWAGLVRSIAAGDQLALHALYERTHRLVFTLIVRITSNRATAEELTLDVYQDVWRSASRYDPAGATVLGWIMNQARSRAIDRLRFEQRKKRAEPERDSALLTIDLPDYRDALEFKEQNRALNDALAILTPGEREAIEAAFFSASTHDEVAARFNQPPGTIKALIRSGLHKLRQALGVGQAMSSFAYANRCAHAELACAYAVHALPAAEAREIEDHLASCAHCRRELEALRSVVDAFVYWPTEVLRPPASLQQRLAQRIAADAGAEAALPAERLWSDPEWLPVGPGIACKLLATDAEKKVVSMLVRLAPGGEYPAHTHAGVEELHLLEGELWIDDRKLQAGEYNRAEPGTGDRRVWSPGGCTCVLVTSIDDRLL